MDKLRRLKHDMLFVRACKSDNSVNRIDKLYRKFYWDNKKDSMDYYIISTILTDIINEYYPINPKKLINNLNPYYASHYVNDGKNYTYYEQVLGVLISHLQLAPTNKIKYYIYPKRYRK